MRISLRAAAMATAAALVLAGCSGTANDDGPSDTSGQQTSSADGGSGSSSDTPETNAAEERDYTVDGTFTVAVYGDLGTLNPMLNASSVVREVTPYAYDRLLYLDENGEPHGWLAESWESDLTSVTYTLKDGITCSDGTPLTASTVAANFAFIDDEANESPVRGALIPAGLTTTADDASRTLTVTFDQPSSFLLAQTGVLDILCQSALDDPTSIDNATAGTGMYVLDEALPGDSYTLTRRDGYRWSFDDTTSETPGLPKTVVVRVINNQSTMANMLLSGELNAGRIEGPDVDRVAAAGFETMGSDTITGQFWFVQSEVNPTADPAVRQALVAAVDLPALSQIYTGGRGTAPQSMLSTQPRTCNYTTVPEQTAADPAEAARLLDEAGYLLGDDGRRAKDGAPLAITLLYDNTNDGPKAAAENAQASWDALGIDVTLNGGDESYVIGGALGADATAGDVAWIPLQMDNPSMAVPFLSGPGGPDGTNLTRTPNEDYVALTAEAGKLAGADSCDAWKTAESALIDDLDTLPFAQTPYSIYLNGATSTAFSASPLGPALRLTR